MLHRCATRTFAAPCQHLVQKHFRPAEFRFHTPVGKIPDPSAQPQRERLRMSGIAKAHPLHVSLNKDM